MAEVARVIRELRPEVVLGHDPWKRYRLHPDHRHAGWLVCDAIVAARDPHFFPEHGLAPHRPAALLLWEADEPNHAEDVTAFVDRKLAALEAHESQFESTMHAADASELEAFRDRIRTASASSARPHGVAAAEVFAAPHRPLTADRSGELAGLTAGAGRAGERLGDVDPLVGRAPPPMTSMSSRCRRWVTSRQKSRAGPVTRSAASSGPHVQRRRTAPRARRAPAPGSARGRWRRS